MPEEQENPIERRESGGGIGRRSDIARRGMNAANYVSGLAARQEADLQQTSTKYTYEFLCSWGEYGAEDGQFNHPWGLAIDSDGTVYVSDTYNNRIQVFDSQGRFLRKWRTIGEPTGLALDREGNVCVAGGIAEADTDPASSQGRPDISVYDPVGRFLYEYEWETENATGRGLAVMLALDNFGNVYVKQYPYSEVEVFDHQGRFLRMLGTEDSDEDQFSIVGDGLAIDNDGNVYVRDTPSQLVQVFDPQGRLLRKWRTTGRADDQSVDGGLAVDWEGNVYVVERINNRIQVFDAEGAFLGTFGVEGHDDGQFDWPTGLAINRESNVYVADHRNHRIQVFKRTSRSSSDV